MQHALGEHGLVDDQLADEIDEPVDAVEIDADGGLHGRLGAGRCFRLGLGGRRGSGNARRLCRCA